MLLVGYINKVVLNVQVLISKIKIFIKNKLQKTIYFLSSILDKKLSTFY